uniref:F-box domain-containing protein n=1 Tax=Caenorhabditis tropicalis TaxID=1561998 RepID=A0A1I7UTL5_9PELO
MDLLRLPRLVLNKMFKKRDIKENPPLIVKMDLLRLPLVVLIEVFKNMDFREKFLISLLSKRARSTLTLTCVIPHFTFFFKTDLYIGTNAQSCTEITEWTGHIGGEEMRLSILSEKVISREQSFRKRLLLVAYLLDTFKKASVSVLFYDVILPSSAYEFIKMINQRQLCINSVIYIICGHSSEFIPRILDECTEVAECIIVRADFTDDFEYTPPRPFKAKVFHVGLSNNWFNLEKFMTCRYIAVELDEDSKRNGQDFNLFFTKWMNSDVPLQNVKFSTTKEPEYQMIMNALDNQGTKRELEEGWIELKRGDGSEFFIEETPDAIEIFTKQAYLKRYKEE